MKKLILPIVLLMLISTSLMSCSSPEETSSIDESSEISTETSSDDESITIVSSEEALNKLKSLLEKDKRNVTMFFENGMYEQSSKNGIVSPINSDSEYSDFTKVEELFDIYTFPNAVKDYFFSFPTYGEKAVFEKNGVVYATKTDCISLAYPKITDFSMIELSLENATFSFETKYGTKKITIDFETNTLSDSPYRLMYESDYSDKWAVPKFTSAAMKVGSGKALSGKTLIINVFLTDKKSEWETDDVLKTLEKVNESVKWLQSAADEYEIDLTLSSTTTSTSLYYRSSSVLTTTADDQIWINEMFAYTTYGTLDDYIKTNRNVQGYDNYVVLFHINKDGENNFGRYDTELFEKDLYKTERAVMYSGSTVKDYLKAVLYLFGANGYGSAESEASRYFGNEIMLESSVLNDDLTLGEITAYLIGWKNEIHPQLASLINKVLNSLNNK